MYQLGLRDLRDHFQTAEISQNNCRHPRDRHLAFVQLLVNDDTVIWCSDLKVFILVKYLFFFRFCLLHLLLCNLNHIFEICCCKLQCFQFVLGDHFFLKKPLMSRKVGQDIVILAFVHLKRESCL